MVPPSSRLLATICILVGLLAMIPFSTAQATAPAAPTNFASTFTNISSSYYYWRFSWTDNSTDEDGFRLYYRIGGSGGTTSTYGDLPVSAAIKTATGPLSINIQIPSNAFGTGWSVEWFVAAYKNNAGGTPTEFSGISNATQYYPYPGPQTPNLNAPGALAVTAVGDGAVQVTWNDNSNGEYYFQLEFKKSTDSTWRTPGSYSTFTPGILNDFNFTSGTFSSYAKVYQNPATSDMYLPYLEPNTTYNFRLRAAGFASDFGSYSGTATATTQAFKAPTSLTATRVGESTFDLTFNNNSTAESGYHFQYRVQGSGSWLDLGMVDQPFFNTINSGVLNPNTVYEFQARAYLRNTNNAADPPVAYTAFSNTATGTAIFNAPTALTATTPSEGRVNLNWTDNSSVEGNYEVQVREKGTTQWQSYQYYAANTTSVTNQLIAPGKTLEFRVRATRGAQAEITSSFSNTAEITTAFNAPTNLVATASSSDPYHISFTWTDNSGVETEYELQYRKQGGSFATRKIVAANTGTAPNSMSLADLPEFDPGSVYEFQIRANLTLSDGSLIASSAYSPIATATTKNGFSSKPYAPITQGTPFSYQLATMSQQSRTDWSVGTLPAGLSFDSGTGVISGTPTVAGLFNVPLTANFSGGSSHVLNLALRILRAPAAPQIASAIGDQTLAAGTNTTIDIASTFSDLDTDAVVRMSTTKGNIDVVLYSSLTPGTVANFLAYNYANTLFHRAPTGFVLQGGGYTSYASPDVFESITRQASITNEPGVTNGFGTLAMAKVADDPNSATSEFFINLGNNASNLDNQNGGFTVFGRVASVSTGVLSTLAAVPTGNYAVKLRQNGVTPSSANYSFTDIPIDQTPVPSTIDQTKLMKVTAVTNLPVLSHAITTSPNSAVATATLNGTQLQITAVAPGSTSLVITATDVDGNSTPHTVNIIVPKLPATVTPGGLAHTYDGTEHEATATTNPSGLNVTFTYNGSSTPPTNAGSYTVVATINSPTYQGSASDTLVIAKASASLSLNGLSQAYTGAPCPVTPVTNPPSLPVNITYDGATTPPTEFGTYAVEAVIDDTNYTGTKSGTLTIRGQSVTEWSSQVFTPEQVSAGLAAPDADADGDGLKNRAEYALGTNPNSPTPPIAPVRDGNGLTITFTRPKDLQDVIYGAESSDSFVNWTPLTLEVITDGPVQTVRVRDPLTSGNPARRFIRLTFSAPP